MLAGFGNTFPGKRVPEIDVKLKICRFFQGGVSYSDLTDREESGDLFEAAATFMLGWEDAETVVQQREEARARARNAQLRR